MEAVAVGTHRRTKVPLTALDIMDTFHCLRIFVEVAAPARLCIGYSKIADAPEVPLRVL